jgi:recombination protein RecT
MINTQELARKDAIGSLIRQSQNQIKSLLLGDKKRADQFMAAAFAVGNDSALAKCDPLSIAQSLVGIAMLDLSCDKNLGHAYMVPYRGKAQLQVGYKGFIQLLFRAGWFVKAFPIYHCDQFSITFDGWENRIEMTPAIDERDEGDKDWARENLRGIWVIARHAESKNEASMFVPKSVIEKLRLNSPSQQINDYTKAQERSRLEQGLPIGPWDNWYVEMALGKGVKKLAKTLPLGDSSAAMAITLDDKADMGKNVNYAQTAEKGVVIEAEAESSETKPTTLADVLSMIDEATSVDALDGVKDFVNGLTADEKKQARRAWTDKKTALETPTVNQEPENKGTENIDWEKAIRSCKSTAELNELSAKIHEDDVIIYQDILDDCYDHLRSIKK